MTREEAIELFRVLDQQGIACALSGGREYQVSFDADGMSGDQVTEAITAIKQTLSFAEDAKISFSNSYLLVR
jgi:hypothetical protein